MKTRLGLFTAILTAIFTAAWTSLAFAWTMEPDTSTVTFGSIKNDSVGEAHTFSDLSGTVAPDGTVTVEIGLASVNTAIDIRNERMIDKVFGDAAKATITAAVDMAALEKLSSGESITLETEATLDLLGVETPFDITLFVMRVAEDRVLAATNAPVYLATEDLGIDAGVDALQQLAELDSITRVTPLTARLIFQK